MNPRKLRNSFNQPSQVEAGFFLHAARQGDIASVIQFLNKYPAAVDMATTFRGQGRSYVDSTALIEAAAGGHTAIVDLLLKNGASIDRITNHGWTALSEAAENGRTGAVRLLLDKGAAIDGNRVGGWTPLMSAVWHLQVDTVKLMLERGASINKAYAGKTVLGHIQVRNSSFLTDKTISEDVRKEGLLKTGQIEALIKQRQAGGLKPSGKGKKPFTP